MPSPWPGQRKAVNARVFESWPWHKKLLVVCVLRFVTLARHSKAGVARELCGSKVSAGQALGLGGQEMHGRFHSSKGKSVSVCGWVRSFSIRRP